MSIRTGAQIKAARALLGWTIDDLAEVAGVNPNTVIRWEGMIAIPLRTPYGVQRITTALGKNDVIPFAEPTPGVRLAERPIFATPKARARAGHEVSPPTEKITPPVQHPIVTKQPSREPMRPRRACGAHARSTGKPCQRPALANGRCVNHGGLSTGAKTAEGRARIAEAARRRWAQYKCEVVAS
jgi:transcriptional regulator with XRE-family HTH domain